jgi:hypothetical protein
MEKLMERIFEMAKKSEKRQRTAHIYCRATPQEKEFIQACAAAFNISEGELVRQMLFHLKPPTVVDSLVDQQALAELHRCRADLGRLGGILKGWMGDSFPNSPHPPREVINTLLKEIEKGKISIQAAATKLVKKL